MSENRRRILDMLATGKITVEEAEKLLSSINESGDSSKVVNTEGKSRARYLRVEVDGSGKDEGPEKVNIRVPMQLLRSGVKLASLIPVDAQSKINESLHDKGININVADFKPEMIEDLVESLADISIDVDNKDQKVRIFCE